MSTYRVTLEVNKDPLGSEFTIIKVSSNTKFGAKIKAKKEALKSQDVWVINRIVRVHKCHNKKICERGKHKHGR